MTSANDILKQIKENDVKFVDLRFTDPKGKLQHVTMDVSCVDEDMFADGVMFDGSSIGGWKAINESDMVLMPDTATVHMDPFFAQSTMVVMCDILDPITDSGRVEKIEKRLSIDDHKPDPGRYYQRLFPARRRHGDDRVLYNGARPKASGNAGV